MVTDKEREIDLFPFTNFLLGVKYVRGGEIYGVRGDESEDRYPLFTAHLMTCEILLPV